MEPENSEDTDRLSDHMKSVLRKSDQLADALQSLQSTNQSLKFYTNKLLVKLKEFNDNFSDDTPTNKCGVCYMRNRTHALTPCGHLFCELCVSRCKNRNQCFVCRAEVRIRVEKVCFPGYKNSAIFNNIFVIFRAGEHSTKYTIV